MGGQDNVTQISGGINLDANPLNQPKGTRRFTLNTVEESAEGDKVYLGNEPSNGLVDSYPAGYYEIGKCYMVNNENCVMLHNPSLQLDIIGVLKNDKFTEYVKTDLNFHISKQLDCQFRLRKGKFRTIYFVDGYNNARIVNLDNLLDHYTQLYKNYLDGGGDPSLYIGEKWDISSFSLFKIYSQYPTFEDIEILEYGTILPGSYNFAIRLLDDDLNPTHWITTSNIVNIFNDTITNNYDQIEGSKNVQLHSQSFPRASKSIKLTLGNLDSNYPFYQIAVIQGINVINKASRALVSQNIATTTDSYIYSGDDQNMTEIAIPEILLEQISINKPESIEQIENRLELANGTDIPIDFCSFQQFASEIRTEVITKEVTLNSVRSEPNSKNAKSSFMYTGYMPGQPVSLGIVYLIDDNSLSPVYHIPGKSVTSTSNMDYYEVEQRYLNLYDCTSGDYWGNDYEGNPLTGKHIRHHKPPTRKNLGLNLYNRTLKPPSTATRWKLEIEITIASGDSDDYPEGADGPLTIGYTFKYRLQGLPELQTYTNAISKDGIKKRIVIYDGTIQPQLVSGGDYMVLDNLTSQLDSYLSDLDIHYYGPTSYTAEAFLYEDTAQLIGINVSNVKKPHPRVVGFFIVRNEMTDADKVVLDNALIGNTSTYGKYVSFGHFIPEILNSKKDKKSVYFFSPVHQFTGLKPTFLKFDVQGYIEQTKRIIGETVEPTDTTTDAPRGVFIEDVMAGTTFDPNLNKKKNKDGDGFDLLIGTIGREFKYVRIDSADTTSLPPIVNMYYINASFYRSDGEKLYYNTSVDNKIGFAIFGEDIDLDLFLGQAEVADPIHPQYPKSMNDENYKYRLLYSSMVVDNRSAFANFVDRPYYKEHNNPVMFNNLTTVNDTKIFNGDAHIGPMSLMSSVFFETQFGDRNKKNKTWQIVAGAVLVVAAVAVNIIPGIGQAASALIGTQAFTLLIGLAVSYGVSTIVSGIKFEQMKSMIDDDYPAGLQETITDAQVEKQLRKKRDDDTFKWFSGTVANIYMESYINIALRTGLTQGTSDFLPSPRDYTNENVDSYITDKFTVIDRDHESGRLYKGYGQAEFYDENPDYRRINKEKVFYHLPLNYDCCDKDGQAFTNRVWYSQQSFQEETVDNFRIFLPNNYRDIEAERGVITDLFKDGNSLYIHTTEGLWKLPTSYQERVTGELTTFIGTGSFFSIPPIPIGTGDLGVGGSKHKWATIKTDGGVFFASEVEGIVYILNNGQIQPLTENGLSSWFANYLVDNLSRQFNMLTGIVYPNQNNPANPQGVGIHAIYDPRFSRYIITKRDYKLIKDANTLVVVDEPLDVQAGKLNFILSKGMFAKLTDDTVTYISLSNTDYFENKSWTISFSLNTKTWVSWHSYLPLFYVNNQDGFYSLINNGIWKHNIIGKFGSFYGQPASHMIEYVALKDGMTVCTIESIMIESLARRWDAAINNWFKERNAIFTKLIAYTESQCSGEQIIIPKDSESEFYMSNQVINQVNSIIASRKETFWSINQLRDFVDDYTQPFLSRKWDDLKAKYFMDKVINPATINFNKDWFEIQSFRDKYVVVRLIFDTVDDVNLLTNYFINTETLSIR